MAKKAQCFGYCRVSGRGQVKGHGLPRQRSDIAVFAAREKMQLVKVYEDAHTGTEADRPQFMQMLSDCIDNGVKIIVVESLDRLARDLMIQTQLLAKLVIEGISLIAANTGEDVTGAMADDPMRKAMVQIQGVFAELDKNLLVRRLRKGRDAKRQSGELVEGKRPYGQAHDPVQRERELIIVARVHKLRRKPRGGKRLSLAAIASKLNAEGHSTRSGKQFTGSIVQGIVDRNLKIKIS